MHKAYLVDKNVIDKDPHFAQGCGFCHSGDEKKDNREDAHKGLTRRPSDNPDLCGNCHSEIAKKYKNALHYTIEGDRYGVMGRLSKDELTTFNEKVFEKSCRSCHASCGDCHVKSPIIGGINPGLIKGHKFVRKDEAKTCSLCHGGRVYPEFTGEYGGNPDVHYTKGMTCMNCHKIDEMHGDGTTYKSRKHLKNRPSCKGCHPYGTEKTDKAKSAHRAHKEQLSCFSCHSGSDYRNCYDCHLGKGATSKAGFILGLNPRDMKTITTLRLIPTVRDTFKDVGITMKNFDTLPNYWDTAPHNIKKRTDRTRSCDVCHVDKKYFLTTGTLVKDGSKFNERLIHIPKTKKQEDL